jgi:hypothetical protein
LSSSSPVEHRVAALVWVSVPLYFVCVMTWFLAFGLSPWADFNLALLSFTKETFARIDFNYSIINSLSGVGTAESYLAFSACCIFWLPIVGIILITIAILAAGRATASSPQKDQKKADGRGRSLKHRLKSAMITLVSVLVPTALYFVYMTSEFSLTNPGMFPQRFVIGAFFGSFMSGGLLLVWNFAILSAAAIGLQAGSKVRP